MAVAGTQAICMLVTRLEAEFRQNHTLPTSSVFLRCLRTAIAHHREPPDRHRAATYATDPLVLRTSRIKHSVFCSWQSFVTVGCLWPCLCWVRSNTCAYICVFVSVCLCVTARQLRLVVAREAQIRRMRGNPVEYR